MQRIVAGGMSLLLALVLSACGGGPKIATEPAWQPDGDAEPLRGLLQYMPPSTHLAIGVPTVDLLDAQVKILSESAGISPADLLGKLFKNAKVDVADGFAAALAGAGVDTAQPFAAFVELNGGTAVVASVKDEAQLASGITQLFGGDFADVKLKTSWHSFVTGGFAIKWNEAAPAGYFVANGKVFIAASKPLLMGFLERNLTPASIAYGKGDYPGKGQAEMVVLAHLDETFKTGMMSVSPRPDVIESLMTYFNGKADELTVTASLGATPAYLRIATHKGASALPWKEVAPLELGKAFPTDTYLMLNLRKFKGFIDVMAAVAASKEMDKDVKKTFNTVSAASMMLGEEYAAGVVKAADGNPALLVILPMTNTSLLGVGLSAIGVNTETPNFVVEDAKGYVIANEKVPFPITLVLSPTLVLASTSEQVAKDAMMAYKTGGNTAPTPLLTADVTNNGTYGYLVWDAKNAVSSINSLPLPVKLPENVTALDMGSARSNITMASDKEWNLMTLTVSDPAALVQKIAPMLQ